jgi:oxygen-independent coproporphyrinogen-3 oxidase
VSRRWWNVRTPDRYIALLGEGASPEAGHETLDGADREGEAAMLALRTRHGVARSPEAGGLVADGLAARHGDRVVLTPTGRLLANEATARLLGACSSC